MSKSRRYKYRKPKVIISNGDYMDTTPLAVTTSNRLDINGELYLNGIDVQSVINNSLTIDSRAEEVIDDLYAQGFQRHEIVNAIAGAIRMQRGW